MFLCFDKAKTMYFTRFCGFDTAKTMYFTRFYGLAKPKPAILQKFFFLPWEHPNMGFPHRKEGFRLLQPLGAVKKPL